MTDTSVTGRAATPTALTDTSVTSTAAVAETAEARRRRPGRAAEAHPEGATLFGRITGPDGLPDPTAEVGVWSEGPSDDEGAAEAATAGAGRWANAEADGDGRYRAEGIAPGKVSVRVGSKRFRSAEVEMVLAPRETAERDFALEAGAAVAGRVVDPDREPVPGIRVKSQVDDREAETDGQGRFRLTGFEESRDEMTLSATDPEGTYAPASAAARPGDEAVEIVIDLGAAVEGTVVEKGTRAPVEGARVAHATYEGGPFGRVRPRVGGPTTDARGRFALKGLAPGQGRTIRALKPGYAPAEVQLDLAAGDTHSIEIEIGRGATARGIVRDPEGRPLPDALVLAVPPGGSGLGMDGMFPAEALADMLVAEAREPADVERQMSHFGTGGAIGRTDPEGRFEVPNLAPGKHAIAAAHPGFVGAAVGVVIEGEENPPEVQIRLGRGGTVEGRVIGKDGRPVAGAGVGLFSMLGGQKRATTSADGTYRIAGVRPGTYMGMVQTETGRFRLGPDEEQMRTVTVEEGRVARLDFGGELPGAVVSGTIRRGGKPYDGEVMLMRPGGLSLEGLRQGKADAEGRFRIEGVAPGRYEMWLKPATRVPFEVPEGAAEVPVALDLPALSLRGRVTGPDGAPIEGARVRAVRASDLDDPMLSEMADAVSTGAGGAFEVEGLDDVEYVVEASHAGYARARSAPVRPSAGAAPLALVLSWGGKIRARATDPEGEPVAGIFIVADDEATGARLMTEMREGPFFGSSGEAVLDGVPAGTYSVSAVTLQGAFDRRTGVRCAGEGEVRLDFTIGPGGTLAVEARDLAGAPVAGASLAIAFPDGRPLPASLVDIFAAARTSSAGLIKRERLAPGTYLVTVAAADGRTGKAEARVREEEETRVVVTLTQSR